MRPPPPRTEKSGVATQDRLVRRSVSARVERRRGRSPVAHVPAASQALRPRKTKSINVTQLQVSGRIRRVGNGLAVLIPVREARSVGLAAGDPVDVVIRSGVPDAFGLLSDLPYRPFERGKEGLWRERI